MKEKKINEFLTQKLEEGITHIFVNGKKFLKCKRLVVIVPKLNIPVYDKIDFIDEAVF